MRQISRQNRNRLIAGLLVIVHAGAWSTAADGQDRGASELRNAASWKTLSVDAIQQKLQDWVDAQNLPADKRASLNGYLTSDSLEGKLAENAKLDGIMATFSLVHPEIAELVDRASTPNATLSPAIFESLSIHPLDGSEDVADIVGNHANLYAGRWLVQNRFYDEALRFLEPLETTDVMVPESLLFYRSLAQHQLLKKKECLSGLNRLLEQENEIPTRFSTVARMMLADLEPLQPDSLDEISRIMKDIGRRTGFYRSGKIVINQEQQVLDKLDKLIEKIEKQQQQQQQGASAGGSSSAPMQDSNSSGEKGSGKVANKQLPEGGQWGDLPPAKRSAALAELTRDLPPHYRAAIEDYFRKLAAEKDRD